MKTLGERVRLCRNLCALRREDVAQRLGVSVVTITNIETDKVDPRASSIAKLAQVFGVSTDYLHGVCTDTSPVRLVSHNETLC